MFTWAARTHGSAALFLRVLALLLFLAAPGLAQDPPPRADCTPADAVIIAPELDHGIYRGAGVVTRRVRLEGVTDVRGGDPCAAGFTVRGAITEKRTPLYFDRPVVDYVHGVLDRLLGTAGAASPGAVPVVVEIEQFDIDYARGLLGAGDPTLEARLSVHVVTPSGPIRAGWVQARETVPKGFSLTGAQKATVYPGMVALARGFEDPALPLERLAGTGTAIAPDGAAVGLDAARQTIHTEYRTPLQMNTRSHPTWRAIYLDASEAETHRAYGEFFGIALGGVTWWRTAGSGLEGEIGFVGSSGKARVLDPSWSVTTAKLEMWALPMSATYLYRLGGGGGSPNFAPYVGTGVGLIAGLERMRLDAENDDANFSANLGAFRGAFEGHGVLGADFHVAESIHGMIESRWIQSGNGSTVEYVDDKKPEDVAASDLLHSIIRRSNFNFTGWALSAGVRWDLP